MKPSIMLRGYTLTFFFLFISFSAKSVSSAEVVFADSKSSENEFKVSYSRKAVQSAIGEVKAYSESESEVPYSNYCSSIVPESVVTNSETYTESFGTFDGYEIGYYIGGNRILNPKITRFSSNSLSFEARYVSKTVADGVWKIKGTLTFFRSYHQPSPFHLKLHGFLSASSGNLCMVGTGSAQSEEGNLLTPPAVFKLRNIRNSNNITTLVTGTLESLSSSDGVNYFEPISIIMFPLLNYEYTFDFRECGDEFSAESGTQKNLPFNEFPSRSFCSILGHGNVFKLQYTTHCSSGKQNCLPFPWLNGYLPRFVSFSIIRCTEVERKIQVLVKFRNSTSGVINYPSFNPNTTLTGEGTWDARKNQLLVVVCQFLNITESWSNAHVGDCTTRLSFRFPAILSIRETSTVMGQIWTTKIANDSGYFERIVFRSTENHMKGVPGLKYEYTEFNRVKNLCFRNEQLVRNKGQRYPSGRSTGMRFGMLVKSSGKKSGSGFADPLAIDGQLYKPYLYPMDLPGPMFETAVPTRPINVSYEVSIALQTPTNVIDGVNFSYLSEKKMDITTEGIYDSETGKLCMVGCRTLGSDSQVFENVPMDCEILLNFQLPPLEPNENGGYIMGSIKSTRKSSDPLYFHRLDVTSATYKTDQQRSSIWTMDLASNTLLCIFVGLQLYHVKKNPKVLPFISIVMLVILTLGQMVPLALDFETLCSNKQDLNTILPHNGGLFDLNEMIVTVVMVVPFLLLLRLLQLTASARSHDSNKKSLRFAEEMTLLLIAFLYAAGAKFALLVAWERRRPDAVFLLTSPVGYQHNTICNDWKSYAGLILDCFLLPQILFNMFSNSKQKALSRSFYAGTTFARLLPHAIDLYRHHSYDFHNIFHFSVNADVGFISAACDVTMFLGLLLLAAIIYFQQKLGGHCILPSRLRRLQTYP